MKTNAAHTSAQPERLHLRLRGAISPDGNPANLFDDWLRDPRVTRAGGLLIVEGDLEDQSALYGLLSFVRDLGLHLQSVELISNQFGEKIMNKNLVNLIFKAVALAMGVAVVVLNLLGSLTPAAAMPLLGLGLAALSLAVFERKAA